MDDSGFIVGSHSGDQERSSVPNIYAIGDVLKVLLLLQLLLLVVVAALVLLLVLLYKIFSFTALRGLSDCYRLAD